MGWWIDRLTDELMDTWRHGLKQWYTYGMMNW